jgi:hypothetical protein
MNFRICLTVAFLFQIALSQQWERIEYPIAYVHQDRIMKNWRDSMLWDGCIDNGVMYLSRDSARIIYSNDGGVTWDSMANAFTTTVKTLAANNGYLWAQGLGMTNDYGNTWVQCPTGMFAVNRKGASGWYILDNDSSTIWYPSGDSWEHFGDSVYSRSVGYHGKLGGIRHVVADSHYIVAASNHYAYILCLDSITDRYHGRWYMVQFEKLYFSRMEIELCNGYFFVSEAAGGGIPPDSSVGIFRSQKLTPDNFHSTTCTTRVSVKSRQGATAIKTVGKRLFANNFNSVSESWTMFYTYNNGDDWVDVSGLMHWTVHALFADEDAENALYEINWSQDIGLWKFDFNQLPTKSLKAPSISKVSSIPSRRVERYSLDGRILKGKRMLYCNKMWYNIDRR